MKILAVDTATKTCAAAIVDNGEPVAEIIVDQGKTHTRILMKIISDMLSSAGMRTTDIDGLAVTIGPGSFTGLRIGLATVKGLALSRGKPIAGISTLDALAAPVSKRTGQICAMLDARRGEVYTALYRCGVSGLIQEGPARAASPEQALAGISGPVLFVGDGALAYKDRILAELGDKACFAEPGQHMIRASAVGKLGTELIIAGKSFDAFTLVPLYLRRSDAEKAISGL
jgi:tRNA threonylcarbamoyladenosine biosynthesis protein TsaB